MISFIVIGRNEEKNLKKCFESIFSAVEYSNIKDYEIIYVDSKSQDKSIEIAHSFNTIKVFGITGCCNAAIGRNIGAKESGGDVLFFIDGDMEINKEFLPEVLDEQLNLKGDFVSGKVVDVVEGLPDNIRNPNTNAFTGNFIQLVPGGIFLIKRECWEAVHGMRTKFKTGEEADLGYRLNKKGYKFSRVDKIITRHNTYNSLEMSRMWKGILNKSVFYPRCVTYRDHFANKYIYYGLWAMDKTFILMIISIVLMLIFPVTIPVLCIIYFMAILLRSLKQIKDLKPTDRLSGFQYVLYYFLFDFLNLIYFFTFFPKDKKLEYIQK